MRYCRLLILLIAGTILNTAHAQDYPVAVRYQNGVIVGGLRGGINRNFFIETRLPATKPGTKAERVITGKHRIQTEKYIRYFDHECRVTNTVTQRPYGLDWDIEITGLGDAWTVPVETRLKWDTTESLRFWTTWPGSHFNTNPAVWQNPFTTAPFRNLDLVYGGETHLSPASFVVPVASTFIHEKNTGVSFIQSLNDTIMDLMMRTSASGTVSYIQTNRRISNSSPVRISHRIVVHAADWRAGMAWMFDQYKPFFLPEEPLVNEVAGCGAYSSWEGEIDTARYKKMAFSFNWKASFDFPFMGMFIPPVTTDSETWRKFSFTGNGDTTSVHRLRNYSEKFRRMGFHTVSYFNITEFGNRITYPYKRQVNKEEDIWKDANDFLYLKMKSGLLRPAKPMPEWDDRPIFSNWEDCVAMDPGDSVYQAFLLNQAMLHTEKIPASAGICIDRLDWLRFYNGNGDDGVSFTQGNKVRSLIMSWNGIMEKIGRIMHNQNKVILCNPLYRRIDLMKHIDGFYEEYGQLPLCLNLSAQLGMFKPVVAWTVSPDDFQPGPDAYFQQHLYMGAFLTVPFPGNDHTILPGTDIEKYYLDYGPLLSAIKGREWVLIPDVISVKKGNALANIFRVKEKILIPVVLAGAATDAMLTLQLPRTLLNRERIRVKALYPGSSEWILLDEVNNTGVLELPVQLRRGCVLLCLE